jgi:hypothetical protein
MCEDTPDAAYNCQEAKHKHTAQNTIKYAHTPLLEDGMLKHGCAVQQQEGGYKVFSHSFPNRYT